jgi:Cu2+-exporting ATPase
MVSVPIPVESRSSASECFHCGQSISAGVVLSVNVEGRSRPMCCAGCLAVCEAIVNNGLGEYYRHRESFPASGSDVLPQALLELSAFDHPEFQKNFVRPLDGDEREADLILEGITCAACVWLNERHLSGLSGVTAVQVNYATHRACVRWRNDTITLSKILAAIVSIGYRAHPYDPDRSELLAQSERRTALWRLFVAGFGMMQVMMYAYPAYIAAEGDMSPVADKLMRWASMILTAPVVLYSAAPFFVRAWRNLRARHLGMDVPVALGVGSAFLASVWATLAGAGAVYFDSVTMFVFFLLSARYLEMLARQHATRGAEALGRLIPAFARRIRLDGMVEEQVAVSALQVGDRLLVRPGETIVADGLVLHGSSEVNESWLTGESLPVLKGPGTRVMSGSLNGLGVLEVSAEHLGEATRLATICRLIERARNERPKVVAAADRIALIFTGVLLLLAGVAALVWLFIDPDRALSISVAILVVSCPCALSLATPVALTVATDALARAGLLVTRSHAIETLASVNHFVFDKTGTLTEGVLQLKSVALMEGEVRSRVFEIAAALEVNSEHHVGKAILRVVRERTPAARNVLVVPGQGISGEVGGVCYAIGRADYVSVFADSPLPGLLQRGEGESRVYLAASGRWIAAFGLSDGIRASARLALDGLAQRGCAVSILSGDSQHAVNGVALFLGVSDARGDLSPEDKHSVLTSMQVPDCVLAMVGDGINDAPVLAQAQVSIAMAGGTELARHQADIILLGDDLSAILTGLHIAKKTRRVIRENLLWAFTYNVLAIPAAALGWVTPWMAGIGMGLSSLLVVLNALRVARTP